MKVASEAMAASKQPQRPWRSDLTLDLIQATSCVSCVYLSLNSHFSGLRGHSDLHMASEVTSDLKFELSDLNNPSAFLAPKCFSEPNFPR